MTKTVLRDITKCIGRLLLTHRKMQGYSQAQMGAVLGVSFQQVQKYETGVNRISASSLLLLSRAWGIPVSEFFPDHKKTESGVDLDH